MKRISLQLFLALLTFFVGVSLTGFWMFINYPKAKLLSQSVVVTDNTTEQSRTFQSHEAQLCNGQIEIVYDSSLAGVDSLDGIFKVTNNSCETVYYFGDQATNNQNSWIKQNGKVKYIEINRGVEIKERQLKPNESTWFWIPTPQNKSPFEAGFTIKTGDDRYEKTILVKVKKQMEHYGTKLLR